MARAHTTIAVGCLVLGLADVLYLDLAVAPSLLRARREQVTASAGHGAEAEPLLAQRRLATPPDDLDPSGTVDNTGARPGVRAIDPELSARTGAEPEPEPSPRRGDADRGALAVPSSKLAAADADDDESDGDVVDPDPLPDTLPSEPVHVHFARERAALGPRARARLDRIVTWLRAEPALQATIDGHADRSGEPMFNDVLSRRRAERVVAYFLAAGLERRRLSMRAFGERRPLLRGSGIDVSRRNRRVEIRVSPARPGGAP
jgi:outer membrane protein OmpA-like peptidoglycan-associated protein